MKKADILVLEDDPDILELLKYNLLEEGFSVYPAVDGLEAWSILQDELIDLAILDVMVPQLTGTEICKRIRKTERIKDLPILLLSAKDEESDKLVGFMVGADDYLGKPFAPKEVLARVWALLRRSKWGKDSYTRGNLEIFFNRHLVKLDGTRLKLTPREFNVLKALVLSNGKTITRENLLTEVWGMDSNSSARSVDIVITRVREKIKPYDKAIRTVTGFGYQWDEELATAQGSEE